MLRLAGFQDGAEIDPAVGQVLAHAEEEAVQVVTQLDWLRGDHSGGLLILLRCETVTELRETALLLRFPPDFEVAENQRTSRESYPVNTPASVKREICF